MEHWDLIIVGAGVAGLTAGIYGARNCLKTLILEEKVPGGSAAEAPFIENYPGFPEGIKGIDLINRIVKHTKGAGAQIRELEKVIDLSLKTNIKIVKTDKTVCTASAIILALGCHYGMLGAPGENKFRGRGVSHCAVCDGAFFKGKKVIVVGGRNSAVISTIYLSNLVSSVKLVHQRDQLRAEEKLVKDLQKRGVEILWNTEIKKINGDIKVKSVTLFNNKTRETKEVEVDGVFIQTDEVPNSQIVREAKVEVDGNGYIIVDKHQRTNFNGVYAAGDITICPVKRVGTAVGQAILAATEAYGYIKNHNGA